MKKAKGKTLFALWLDGAEMSQAEAARQLNVSRQRANQLTVKRKEWTPGLRLALKIQDMTGGKVPVESWYGGGR